MIFIDIENDFTSELTKHIKVHKSYASGSLHNDIITLEIEVSNHEMINYLHNWFINDYEIGNRHSKKRKILIISELGIDKDVYVLYNTFIKSIEDSSSDNFFKCEIQPDYSELKELSKCNELKSFNRNRIITNILYES